MTKLRYDYRLFNCYSIHRHIHYNIVFVTEVENAVRHLKHFDCKAIELCIVFV